MKDITVNKKARFDYFVEETMEAGIQLTGSEVKSVRSGNVNLKDSFALIREWQVWLKNMHIGAYEKASQFDNRDTRRDRRLLLHKGEIARLTGKIQQKGYTLVVLRLYFKDALIKAELGLCRGKQNADKRRTIAERDQKREIERTLKHYNTR